MTSVFSPSQLSALVVALRISSTIALFSGVAILLDIQRNWNQLKKVTANRLLIWMTSADLIYLPWMLIGNAFLDASDSALKAACSAQGWIIQMGLMASALWTAVLATNIYFAICRRISIGSLRHFEKYYHGFVWTTAIAIATLPVIIPLQSPTGKPSSFYNSSLTFCWIGKHWAPFRMVRL